MPTANDPINYLDVLGQQPGLRIYTQITLCFSLADESLHPAIVDTLTDGLERLSASFPWVAGQVVNEGVSEGNTGVFKVKSLDRIAPLVVKDLRHDPSTMDALKKANFPFSMLDESIIAPRRTIPGSPEEPTPDSDPVFLVQATFITGGLLLTFVGQHNAMDMTGQGQIIDLFSKACRGEPFTSEEVSSGNLDRRNLIPLLDESYKPGDELAHQIVKPPSQPVASTPPPAESSWAYFSFSPTSLTTLKSLATKTVNFPSGFVSTDDTLSAFIWQSVTRARLPRLGPKAHATTLARAVDVRRYLNIPPTHPGLVQNMTYHTSTAQKLVEESLGSIASQLRSAVDPKITNLAYQSRALATLISRSPDKKGISVVATIDSSRDLMLSSWAKLDCYELDFGLGLGKPEAVRRPQFIPFESLLYLMPRRSDGEISLAICLRDEDMERLKVDAEFAKYGTYIG